MQRLIAGMLMAAGVMALAPRANAQDVCQRLWVERNSIYKQNGYCFNTPRGVRYFGNAGCQYDDVNQVPLTGWERQRIAEIVAQERAMGCR